MPIVAVPVAIVRACDALTVIVDDVYRYAIIAAPVPPVGSLKPLNT